VAGDLRVRFGSFEADLGTGELFKDGVRLRLQEKPFQILALLLKTPGQLVTRAEICSKLWPDVFVQKDLSLNTAIRRLRVVLETAAPSASLIESVGRRGYRFCAEVTPTPASPPATPTPANSAGPRLVVIPFANLNGEAQDYFADGLTEQMIVQLGRMCKNLSVVSPLSSLYFARKGKSASEIASELQADYVLSGTCWRIPPDLRITAKLVGAADGRCLWSESYARQETEIFLVQDEITLAICRGLLQVLPKSATASAHLTTTPAVYETYLKARCFANQFIESGFEKATHLFELAIREDPKFAPAHADLALMLDSAVTFGVGLPSGIYHRVQHHGLAALALCHDIAEAHTALSGYRLFSGDWVGAEQYILRALEINPSFSFAHVVRSYLLSIMGHQEQATLAAKRALALDPVSPIVGTMAACVHHFAGRREESLRYLQDCIEMNPRFRPAHQILTLVHESMGESSQAVRSARTAAELFPDTPLALLTLARCLALTGDREAAGDILSKLLQFRATGYVPASLIAVVYAALGQQEEAWTYMEEAIRELDPWRVLVGVDPRFSVLWNDARFPQVLSRIGLPHSARELPFDSPELFGSV
jgi:TolB-like protein/tetratricopeptide (TPR) repeat protein